MKETEAQKKILELAQALDYHNHLYYQLSKQEISDQAYDLMMEELITLEKEFPQFLLPDSPS